jgi:hypothetical protein
MRIVPLDGRPHGTIPQWRGDSRGRWEGIEGIFNGAHADESVRLK